MAKLHECQGDGCGECAAQLEADLATWDRLRWAEPASSAPATLYAWRYEAPAEGEAPRWTLEVYA